MLIRNLFHILQFARYICSFPYKVCFRSLLYELIISIHLTKWNQGAKRLVLLALLLLALPLLLTLQTLLVLPELGERNHQLLAERG